MARPGITYEQVENAITEIIAEGDEPTIEKIRAITGGSPNTVHKHFKVWRSSQPVVERKAPELPENIQEALINEIERQAAAAKAKYEKDLAKNEEDKETLAADGEALEAENKELEEQNSALLEQCEQLQESSSKLQAEMDKLEKECVRQKEAAEEARMELAQARNRIETLKERTAVLSKELDDSKAQLKVSDSEKVAAEKQAAVAEAKQEALASETEKQGDRIKKLEQEIQAEKTRNEREESEIYARHQAVIDHLEGRYQDQITDLKKSLEESEKQKTVLIERFTSNQAKELKED